MRLNLYSMFGNFIFQVKGEGVPKDISITYLVAEFEGKDYVYPIEFNSNISISEFHNLVKEGFDKFKKLLESGEVKEKLRFLYDPNGGILGRARV